MQSITRDELKRRLDKDRNVKVIEVLPPEEFGTFHLPGAVNVPLMSDDFEQRIRNVAPDQDQTVVVYCKNMSCDASRRAASRLDKLGYHNVFAYEGGKDEWKRAGLPTESNAQAG